MESLPNGRYRKVVCRVTILLYNISEHYETKGLYERKTHYCFGPNGGLGVLVPVLPLLGSLTRDCIASLLHA
jgi:hypothetical protein